MPNFAANLSMMFGEVPFRERFAAAARCGFTAVEYLFPYEYAPAELSDLLRANGLTQALFNLSAGDFAAGERGLACLPGREAEFMDSVGQGIEYARALGNSRIHIMAGIVPQGVDMAELEATYKQNIRAAARLFAKHGLTVCVEAINQRSMPGYFLRNQAQAARYAADMGEPNVRLQFDVFHVQMEEGCVALKLREFLPIIGHIQIAGVPDRHEPDTGEINYTYIFELLDELDYSGFVGCEYAPAAHTAAGLSWFTNIQG